MNRKNLVILFGGKSPEHDVSINSASTIISNIKDSDYNVIPIYITKEGKWLLYDGCIDSLANVPWERFGTPCIISPDSSHVGLLRIVGDRVKTIHIDVVFPVMHGCPGEDGTVQGLLELAGIPYVGSSVAASAIAMDKAMTKLVASHLKIRQAEYITVLKEELADKKEVLKRIRYKIGYPCFVKPAKAGSSVGISKASDKSEIEAALELAAKYDDKIVIEKAIVGRELECAILGSGGVDTEASSVGEIIAAAEFYDYDAKYNNSESKTIVPAEIDESISDEIRAQALKIFKAIGCRHLSRVDFFLENETNKIYFNEINTLPGFTAISMYPMLWANMGISTSDLVSKLVKLALPEEE